MALRLSLSISALSRSSLSKFITGTEDPAPPGDSDLTDVFGLLLQNGTELILTEDSEFILRQLVDKNIIITQDNKELILQNFDKNNGKLIYISGETISVNLDNQLIKEGYEMKRVINYRTTHNLKFDENFVKDLKLNMPDIVYIYSQNSAESFLNFIKVNQSENLWMNTNLMCIGEKTSSILNEIKWKKIFLFNPGEEEFLLYKI